MKGAMKKYGVQKLKISSVEDDPSLSKLLAQVKLVLVFTPAFNEMKITGFE